MKKLLVIMLALMPLTATFADNDKPITKEQLPAKAQEFLKQHFADSTVMLVTLDKEFFDTNYDVHFKGGSKVEFDKKGEWTEIEFKNSPLPNSVIPSAILEFAKKHYPDPKFKEIDRNKKGYEVKMMNGIELEFDLNFNLVGYDD